VLVVLNFCSSPETVEAGPSGVAAAALIDLRTGAWSDRALPFRVELPASGHTFFQSLPALSRPSLAVRRE
jgi:hypothetical protein